jgi:hypothetical protein
MKLFSRIALLLCVVVLTADVAIAQEQRNPFGVEDVSEPFGLDISQVAGLVHLNGDSGDRNAEQWAPKASPREGVSLEGDWFGRWEFGTAGTAEIRVIGNRLFALYKDYSGIMSGKTWLLEAAMEGNGRLVGRWVQVGNRRDTGPFVGLIVDDERIDGVWSWDGNGRWDFRRKLK